MKRAQTAAVFASIFAFALAVHGRCDTPRPAAEIMTTAQKEAKAKHKPIFVLFDASW